MKSNIRSIRNGIYLKSLYLFIFIGLMTYNCTPISTHQSNEKNVISLKETQEFMQWLDKRVDLMIRYKASCQQMADALHRDHKMMMSKLKKWREQGLGELLAKRAVSDPSFSQKLTQQILKADLVYSYCAYQVSFRDIILSKNKEL